MIASVDRWRTTPFNLRITSNHDTSASLASDPDLPAGQVAGDRSRAWVQFPGKWSLLVEHGRSATVTQIDDEPLPAWVVDGWAVPIAAVQRGYLCLHASVVDIAGTTVAIAGVSGAGKSTTSSALARRGHHLLVDDVTIVDLIPPAPVVLPFRRPVHLTSHAAALLDIPTNGLEQDPESGKFSWHPNHHSSPADPSPLGAIVLLAPTGDDTVEIEALNGAATVAQVAQHAGRPKTAIQLLGPDRYLTSLATLCNTVPVWRVRRPPQSITLDDVADAIEAIAASTRCRPNGQSSSPVTT